MRKIFLIYFLNTRNLVCNSNYILNFQINFPFVPPIRSFHFRLQNLKKTMCEVFNWTLYKDTKV